jgi:hypothetical protein
MRTVMYNQIRANIRNAYCAEGPDELYKAWCERIHQGKMREAGYLRELLVEVMAEAEETVI